MPQEEDAGDNQAKGCEREIETVPGGVPPASISTTEHHADDQEQE